MERRLMAFGCILLVFVSGTLRGEAALVPAPVRIHDALSLPTSNRVARIARSRLRDKIRGGWIGQMVGNIQGLPFEFKYKDAPGPLPEFTPNLAVCPSDDDTDIEWVHLHAMDRLGTTLVPYPLLAREWIRSIRRRIWVSNERARELIGKAILPPWTSHPALNPHARYNLSGQFCVEAYGLVAPGMPRTASRIGAHYARVTVRGEPIQACSYWTALISLAFLESAPPSDLSALCARALGAVAPDSQHAEMVRDVLEWHRELPADWEALRSRVQAKYRDDRGWNMNATITNGALVLAALLYGQGDFSQTVRLAFALGYDADCNAATCGTILGVLYGARALEERPGWVFPHRYDNGTRDELPASESIDALVDRTLRIAERVLLEEGATRLSAGDGTAGDDAVFLIPPQDVEPIDWPIPPAGSSPEVDESSDRVARRIEAWALGAVITPRTGSSATQAARCFAAIYLVQEALPRLSDVQRQSVLRALEEARSDSVLAPLCPPVEISTPDAPVSR